MVIKVIIDRRRANAEDKFPVKLRFSSSGKSVMYSLNIYAFLDEFDSRSGMLFTKKKERLDEVKNSNRIIAFELERARAIETDYLIKGKPLTIEKLKSELSRPPAEDISEISFNEYFRRFAAEKSKGTRIGYENTLRKIEEYYGKNLRFEDITYAWLQDFDRKMMKRPVYTGTGQDKVLKKTGIEVNTRAIQFRYIRAVFNDAINNDIVGLEKYPFRKFKIKQERTRKRAITVEELRRLFAWNGTFEENWAVDIAKMSFFLMGINMKDLHNLQEFDGTRVYYSRAKTGTPYSIKVEPELRELMNKYAGEKSLLSFSERFKLHSSFNRVVNEYLKDIYENENSKLPQITTYTLRHTWATLAAELDIPKETISAGLGHSSKSVTDVYILFDYKKIDAANRKIIDYVLQKGEYVLI